MLNSQSNQYMGMSGIFVINVNTKLQQTTKGNLKTHKMSVHRNVKYPCDQCEHKATEKGHLKTHKKSVHENIKYPCNQCEYKATTQSNLKRHKISVHYNVKYPCS